MRKLLVWMWSYKLELNEWLLMVGVDAERVWRLFPARSGLTSRFPFRKRRLWEKADETAAIYCEKPKSP